MMEEMLSNAGYVSGSDPGTGLVPVMLLLFCGWPLTIGLS